MRKSVRILLCAVGAVVALGAIAGYVFRDTLQLLVAIRRITPAHAFSPARVPVAPDYADPRSWAALGDRLDGADYVVSGQTLDLQASAEVDVFFLHPTTYLKPDSWNAPIDDADANRLTDDRVLKGQASVFNGCCKVFAPRYRQATFGSFLDAQNGERAFELAYRDTELAFDYFLANFNRGRPFILAGHSQGSRHLERLLAKRISNSELLKRMVAAYAIGYGIERPRFAKAAPDIPVCSSARATRCYVTWNAVGPNAPSWGPKVATCVNPLSWKDDSAHASHRANAGALILGTGQIVPHVADAQCGEGRLLVSEVRSVPLLEGLAQLPIDLGRDVYHAIDYGLYYMNLRQNAQSRVAAYLASVGDTARHDIPGNAAAAPAADVPLRGRLP